MPEDGPTPVVYASDGLRFILADGSVVRLIVSDRERDEEIHTVAYDQGAAVYGDALGVNEKVDIRPVDDPTGDEIQAVQEALEAYDFE